MIRRRSAIEPAIGHMKTDGKLDRHWFKGALRLFYALILVALLSFQTATPSAA